MAGHSLVWFHDIRGVIRLMTNDPSLVSIFVDGLNAKCLSAQD